MKALMVASFVLYGTVFCSSLLAEQVDDLYRGQVQVSNQTSMAQQAGVRDALRQVLVKLTGNSQILGTAKVDELLTHVDDYVAALGYSALSESAMSSNNANIGLDVNFSKVGPRPVRTRPKITGAAIQSTTSVDMDDRRRRSNGSAPIR